MARFRGIGDDALKVIESQRQARLQAAQIAENARANRARESLTAQQLAQSAKTEVANQAHADAQLAEQGRHNVAMEQQEAAQTTMQQATYARNEGLFQQQKTLFQQEQAKRAEAIKAANTSFSGLVRAALFSTAAPQSFITQHNVSIGVADNAPGALKSVFRITDPKSGMGQGIGYVTVGKDGQDVKNVVTPEQVWAATEGVYGPEKTAELVKEYQSRYQLNDPLYAAGQQRALKIQDLQMKKAEADLATAQTKASAAEANPTGSNIPAMLKTQMAMRTAVQEQMAMRKKGEPEDPDLKAQLEGIDATISHFQGMLTGAQGVAQAVEARTASFTDGQRGVFKGMPYVWSAKTKTWQPVTQGAETTPADAGAAGDNSAPNTVTSP